MVGREGGGAVAVVLVVDDHPLVADAVSELLRSEGYEAATAHGGEAALAFIRDRPVDLVVLDVTMPGMSGLDVLRSLRDGGLVPGLPVVMFSARDQGRADALQLGAVGFALKCDIDGLLGLVARHLRHAATPPERS